MSKSRLPRVSLCTPTFNRRPFFKGTIANVLAQDFPRDRMEWIIVDDGVDKIGDLVKDIPFVKYISVDKMPLGKKRNFMHTQCTFQNDDDIIVYIDDDDYYPPERVSHAVNKLVGSKALCAGSSELLIWFNSLNKMYKFGPYGPNHSTAGTFAFKRELLKQTRYDDDAVIGEEKVFLKNYTIPFIQLDPLKTILVFSHEQNTFDKRRLIDPNNPVCKESFVKVKHLIRNKETRKFYTEEIDGLLANYDLGEVKHKPDVLAEIKRRDQANQERMTQERMAQERNQTSSSSPTYQTGQMTTKEANMMEALRKKIEENLILEKELEKAKEYIKLLTENIKARDSARSP